MSKEQSRRLIDIIRWSQSFVEGKGKDENLKKLIVEAEANISGLYISVASEGIKRAIKEKMTEAIFYRVGDLDVACVLWAVTANKSVPNYKTALKAALGRAEQHIATICKETGCTISRRSPGKNTKTTRLKKHTTNTRELSSIALATWM